MESEKNGDGPLTAPAANTKSDLDKFKRRLIRAVARLVIIEKKPEAEVWAQLKEETKCDCKQVWHRMKCLTIKKLKRLLAADDLTDKIPAVARMSISDWLMFDLVLVHEKIDVIEMEKVKTEEIKPLSALLELVNAHQIEHLKGSDLAEAWSRATLSYNANGRQCSPMLMQLRWYLLKELTRNTFYGFWSIYRGNPKNLDAAQIQHRPSPLMMAVAKKYPDLVVKNFLNWEERVEKRLVILPEEFDEKIRAKGAMPDNSPDIVLMEPVIETIGVDSDSEEKETYDSDDQVLKTHENDESNVADKIKPEPIDLEEEEKLEVQTESHNVDDSSNESTDVAPPDLNTQSSSSIINDDGDSNQLSDLTRDDESPNLQQLSIVNDDDIRQTPQTISNNVMDDESILPRITSISGNVESSNLTPTISSIACQNQDKICNVSLVGDEDAEKNMGIPTIAIDSDNKSSEECDSDIEGSHRVISEPIPPSLEEIIKQKAEKFIEEERLSKMNEVNIEKPHVEIKTETEVNIKEEPNIVSNTLLNVPTDLDYINDGIEFVDDGIAFADDDDDDVGEFACYPIKDEVEDSIQRKEDEINADASNKFDLKLLMQPIVYTTKLDDMKSTKLQGFTSLEGMSQIDGVLKESNPKIKSVEILEKQDPEVNCDISDEKTSIEDVEECSDDEPQINDSQKVKLSSQHLQKPKYRTYDPIKLCKNPDFNTRLKRLNMGFFGYTRNIQQLKACKPMTIDLHKTFESKLVNGTLYLASDEASIKQEKLDKNVYEQTVSVVPSAIPVQSLLNNTITNIDDLIPKQKIEIEIECNEQKIPSIERSKVINLPDISEIRRINQRLQTAEVTPVQIGNTARKETLSNQTHVASSSKVRAHIIPLAVDEKTLPYNVSYVDSGDFDRRKNKLKTPNPSYLVKPTRHVSWISKNKQMPRPQHDYLLAEDSLIKMLSLMSSDTEPLQLKKKKPKKVVKEIVQVPSTSTAPETANKDTNNDIIVTSNVSEIVLKANEVLNASTSENNKRRSRKKYCCWAREKMDAALSKRRTSKHKCASYCMCCCRFLLLDKLKTGQQNRFNNPVTETTSNTIELSDNEEERCQLENVNNTIESVIQESREIVEMQSSLDAKPVTESETNNCKEASNAYPETVESTQQNHNKLSESIQSETKTAYPETVESTQQNHNKLSESIQSETKIAEFVKIDDLSSKISNQLNEEATYSPLPDSINNTNLDSSPIKNINITTLENRAPVPRINISVKSKAANKSSNYANNVKNMFHMYSRPPPLYKFRTKQSNALIIDGTNRQPKIKAISSIESKKKRVMYINSTSTMKPEKSPIFLGENKILLTNIIFPDEVEEKETPTNKSQFESATTVPAGVNIVLMPDGELTYNLNPGVTLSDYEIASMPELLKQIKSQLSAHGIKVRNKDNQLSDITTPPNNMRSEIDIDLDAVNNDNSEIINDTPHKQLAISSETPSNINPEDDEDESSEDPNQQLNSLHNSTVDSERCENTQINTDGIETTVDNGQIGLTETSQIDNPGVIENSFSENASRKSLLSDLMEMSGISAEDTIAAAAVPDIVVPPSEDVIDLENIDNDVILSNTNSITINRVMSSGNQPENLSVVTSFKKLKYASELGGKFFKMDTLSGVVTPINVCIKKNRTDKFGTDHIKETFIDLTDEVDSMETTYVTSSPEKDVNILNISSQEMTTPESISLNPATINPSVRPIRLIKSIVKTNNLKLNKHLEASQIASTQKLLAKANKRKQKLIPSFNDDLLEEHLVDDSSHEPACESSESSDDEPLAKVAKRIKFSNDTESSTEKTGEPMEITNEEEEFLDEEMLDDSDIREIALQNSSDEDCILGV